MFIIVSRLLGNTKYKCTKVTLDIIMDFDYTLYRDHSTYFIRGDSKMFKVAIIDFENGTVTYSDIVSKATAKRLRIKAIKRGKFAAITRWAFLSF